MQSTTLMPRPGDLIAGTYVLGEPIGIGGMGVVFDAVQRSLERPVAIKMPRQDVADDPSVRRRFRTEALASSRVTHRNLVSVIDFDETSTIPYLVMERVNGIPLGQLILAGRMTFALAAEVTAQILDALEEAHAEGIVHADVKCANVLVERLRDGRPWCRLIDFGLAHISDDPDTSQAEQNILSGTPAYMAPELFGSQRPSPQSDIYAVGVILYELLTGAPPFTGVSPPEILSRQLEGTIVPPSERLGERQFVGDIDRLVLGALAKNPHERFKGAAELRAALTAAAQRHAGVPSRRGTTLTSGLRVVSPTRSSDLNVRAPRESAPIKDARAALDAAAAQGSAELIAATSLALARLLVDEHRLAVAAIELERAIELLGGLVGCDRVAARWPLLLSLAALYDGLADPLRAQRAARAAYDDAATCGSQVGQQRAQALFTRLHRRSNVVVERRRNVSGSGSD